MTTDPREAVLRVLEHYNFSIWQEKRHEIADALFAAGLIRDEGEIAAAAKICHELGKAEGRKQALEEAVVEIEAASANMYYGDPHVLHEAIEVIRNLMPQPQEATSEPLTASTGHSDLPEAPEAARKPRRCPECGEAHVMGCPDCGADLDMRDHYEGCIRIPGGEG